MDEFLPDGRVMYVASTRTAESADLFAVHPDGTRRTRLSRPFTARGSVFNAELVGDGASVLYSGSLRSTSTSRPDYWVVPSSGGRSTLVSGAIGADSTILAQALLPDGSGFVVAVREQRNGAFRDSILRIDLGAGGPVPRCGGQPATIVGSARGETLRGTPGRDVIVGLGGNDRIIGRGGNDLICGGGGRDRLLGGGGNDRLLGQGGRDRLVGGPGRDTCRGGPGADVRRSCERGRG